MSGKFYVSKPLIRDKPQGAGGCGVIPFFWVARIRNIFLLFLLCSTLACTYREPEVYADIENVRAKPGTHLMAVAVKYLKWQWPNGLIGFPNPGVPKVLKQEARIYLVDAHHPDDLTKITVSFDPRKYSNVAPLILGWEEDVLYFGVFDPTVNAKENSPIQYYKWSNEQGLQEIATVPMQLAYQPNIGPIPDGVFVRYSKGHDTVDVQTERHPDWIRNAFQVDPVTGELQPREG